MNTSPLETTSSSSEKNTFDYNFQKERRKTSDWIVGNGYPALPVAPAQDPYCHHKEVGETSDKGRHCPLTGSFSPVALFTGKNPSYLDSADKPHLVNHREFQSRLPSQHEIQKWFGNPKNGIGTLGGWNDTWWIDIDAKRFSSQEECDRRVHAFLEANKDLQGSYLERTHSGGYRIAVRVKVKPKFTNFALTPGGQHVGEVLGNGRFTVLAPTIGPSGQPYQTLNRAIPVWVSSLESIGIYPVKTQGDRSIQPSLHPDFSATPGSIPLEALGNNASLAVLSGENISGDRSAALANAIQEWCGWQNWAAANGISTIDLPEELAHRAGSQLGIDSDRVERILKTVNPAECQPAALYKGDENSCWKKIYRLDRSIFEAKCPLHRQKQIYQDWGQANLDRKDSSDNNGRPPESSNGGNEKFSALLQTPQAHSLNFEHVKQQIREAINQDLSPTDLQIFKLELKNQHTRLSIQDINHLFNVIQQEIELKESRENLKQEVNNFLKIGDQSLNLCDFLPPDLEQPLSLLSRRLNMRPEVALMCLLGGVSSLHSNGTAVTVSFSMGFAVSPNLFVGVVSPSGQKKSPFLKQLVYKPMFLVQQTAQALYLKQVAEYEAKIEEFNQLKGAERKAAFPDGSPPKPVQRLYFCNDLTSEGLRNQVVADPFKVNFYVKDELAGIFNSENQYRSGRGSDREDLLLSGYDGYQLAVLRADGIKAIGVQLLLAIVGGIQPEVLRRHMRDCSDADGTWSRFLFVLQPLAASEFSDDGVELDISERIADYYHKIDALPVMRYRLSPQASKRYKPIYNLLEKQRVSESLPGFRAVYAKMQGQIAKLALNLHVLHELAAGKAVPSSEIPVAQMKQAIALARFLMGQVRVLHAESAGERGDLAPHLLKLITRSKNAAANGEGWISARDYQQSCTAAHRPCPEQIRSWMRELVELGYGSVRGEGRKLEFNHQKIDAPPTSPLSDATIPESPEEQALEAVGTLPTFCPQNSNPPTFSSQEPEENHYAAESVSQFPSQFDFVGNVGSCGQEVGSLLTNENPAVAGDQKKVVTVGNSTQEPATSNSSSSIYSPTSNQTIQPGSIVNKRFKRGWRGSVQSIDEQTATALVLWAGEKYSVRENLADLKLAEEQ